MAQKTNTELKTYNTQIDTNNSQSITGNIHHVMNNDIIDSFASKSSNPTLLGLFPFESSRSYTVGQACLYNDEIRICLTNTTGVFNSAHWGKQSFNVFSASTAYFTSLSADTIFSGTTNLYDLILNEYGTIESMFLLLTDNDLSPNSEINANQELIVSIDNLNKGNKDIKNFIIKNNIIYTNNSNALATSGDYNNDYNNDYYK